MSMVSTVGFNITEVKVNLVLALLCRVHSFTKENVTFNFYISSNNYDKGLYDCYLLTWSLQVKQSDAWHNI
jgi:hypothetical protein